MKNTTRVEEFIMNQKSSRNHEAYRTSSRYKQNDLIRNHLVDYLSHRFDWNYWITLTFGYKPYMDEVEDLLYRLHHRIDNRLLCHSGKSIMLEEERSEWILFPEVDGRGLHYHGFIKLNLHPNLGVSYENEWSWMRTAFHQTLSKMNHMISSIEQRKLENGFRIYGRSKRAVDNLKMAIYSMKQYGRSDFDRFNYTIFSKPDWKPSRLDRHRQQKKFSSIPPRRNKIEEEGTLIKYLQ